MSAWKSALALCLFYGTVLLWTSVSAFRIFLSFVKRPRNIFKLTKRQEIPQALKPAYLSDVTHRYVKLKSGLKLHCAVSGVEGRPLMLCLHGFPEFWYSWRHQLKEFADTYYVVAPDLRGYGESDIPKDISKYSVHYLLQDVKELIIALGYEKVILVAHDWGGVICWTMCEQYPELIDKAIIMNCPNGKAMMEHLRKSRDQFLKSWYIFFFQFPFLPELLMYMDDFKSLERFFMKPPIGIKSGHFTKDDLEAFKFCFANCGMTGPINYYRANMNIHRRPRMPNADPCPRPILLIWGTDDAALALPLAEMSAKRALDCEVKYVDGASHWVQQDQPQIVNKLMRQFLKDSALS